MRSLNCEEGLGVPECSGVAPHRHARAQCLTVCSLQIRRHSQKRSKCLSVLNTSLMM